MFRFFLILLIFINYNSFSQSLSDNLLLHYPFNENANDLSNNNYNGIIHNATLTTDRFNNENSAYYFNGVNSYIEIPNETGLKPDFPFAVSLWFKVDQLSGGTKVLFTNDEDLNGNVYSGFWILYNSSGRISAGYGNALNQAPSGRKTKHSNQLIETGNWYHVTASFNSIDSIDLYIDCILDEGYYSGTASSIEFLNMSGAVGRDLGQHQESSNHQGKIDDIRFYNRELTQSDVTKLCNENTADISENDLPEKIKIYPNPAKNKINIVINNSVYNNYNLKITNLLGQLIYSDKIVKNNTELNLNKEFKKGIYFIKISNDKNKVISINKLIVD